MPMEVMPIRLRTKCPKGRERGQLKPRHSGDADDRRVERQADAAPDAETAAGAAGGDGDAHSAPCRSAMEVLEALILEQGKTVKEEL